jgi:hypothetical protein
VFFGEQNDMVFPERVGMVEGKNPLVLEVYLNILKALQNLAAIEKTFGIIHWLLSPILKIIETSKITKFGEEPIVQTDHQGSRLFGQ